MKLKTIMKKLISKKIVRTKIKDILLKYNNIATEFNKIIDTLFEKIINVIFDAFFENFFKTQFPSLISCSIFPSQPLPLSDRSKISNFFISKFNRSFAMIIIYLHIFHHHRHCCSGRNLSKKKNVEDSILQKTNPHR